MKITKNEKLIILGSTVTGAGVTQGLIQGFVFDRPLTGISILIVTLLVLILTLKVGLK